MKKVIIIFLLFISVSFAAYPAMIYLKKFDFDDNRALDKWGRMILNGQVKYLLMKRGNNGYVEALSEKACSALYYKIGFKSKDYPLLSWKWRVLKFPNKSYAKTDKERDDYAARVYVIYPFLNFSSSKFIEYIWDKELPAGTLSDSPRGRNIKQIVVRSGESKSEDWVSENRNIYDDYVTAFGKKPNLSVGAIAIMCNADNTKTEAESLFDEIVIANETGLKRRLDER